MRFSLLVPKLIFGVGSVESLADAVTALGIARPLLVSDAGLARAGHLQRVRGILSASLDCEVFDGVAENPVFAGVDRGAEAFRRGRCDAVIALGGGSVIDTAKMIAVLAGHPGVAADYVGFSERVTRACAPIVVVPTTAGTGSESSPDAGIHPDAASISSGITSRYVVPQLALCDPELTLTLPPRLTAATGLDALSHCVEGFLSKTDNPLADQIALDGLRRVWTYVERATNNGGDIVARSELMLAAFEGGIAIGKGLGPAHAIAVGCGDQGLHHGILSAIGVVASTRKLAEIIPDKMAAISHAVGVKDAASFPDELLGLMKRVGLPGSLSEAGYKIKSLGALAQTCSESHFNLTSVYAPKADEYAQMIDGVAD